MILDVLIEKSGIEAMMALPNTLFVRFAKVSLVIQYPAHPEFPPIEYDEVHLNEKYMSSDGKVYRLGYYKPKQLLIMSEIIK